MRSVLRDRPLSFVLETFEGFRLPGRPTFVPAQKWAKARWGFARAAYGLRLQPLGRAPQTPIFTGVFILSAIFYHRRLQFCTDFLIRHAPFSGLRASLRSVALSHARLRAGVRFARGYNNDANRTAVLCCQRLLRGSFDAAQQTCSIDRLTRPKHGTADTQGRALSVSEKRGKEKGNLIVQPNHNGGFGTLVPNELLVTFVSSQKSPAPESGTLLHRNTDIPHESKKSALRRIQT